jgi:hypothetical protein
MKMTLKLIAAVLIASVAIAGAADDDAKKKDKPAKKAGGLMTADKDKDGKITLDEFKAWGAARSKPLSADKAETIFKKRDKNSDGAITKDELARKKPADGAGKKKGKKKGDKAAQ